MEVKANSIQTFFSLVRAGLWEKETSFSSKGVAYPEVRRLANEQSLMGVVAAGLGHLQGDEFPEDEAVQYIGRALKIEKKNADINVFIARIARRLKEEGIGYVMVKGQGVAQCYEKPMWRASGDVDLLLDEESYQRAKLFLTSIAESVHEENPFDKHFSAIVEGWVVELHGSMRSMLTKRADHMIDMVQKDTFENRRFRIWKNGSIDILLPNADDDVIYVFTHILKHFFHYGIGLRQVCDWVRFLFTYQSEIDLNLLESRLRAMKLMSEWKAFGALAVDWLGMPSDAMPFYSSAAGWKRKARRILSFVLETGNFGHNRIQTTSLATQSPIVQKLASYWQHTCDSVRHFFIFPVDAVRIWIRMTSEGVKDVAHFKD